jgi:hypothetical protein
MEPIHLQGKTLHEKQMRYYNGMFCVYCDSMCDFVDSIEVYRESHGNIYLCRKCSAHVGCHYKTSDHSFGFAAKEPLRKLRNNAHKVFDPLWETKAKVGTSRKQAQAAARRWMADLLGIAIEEAHIGMLYDEQCEKLITECLKYYPSPEQQERKRLALQRDVETIHFLAGEFDFTAAEISLMGKHSFTLSKEGRTKMFLKLPENVYAFDGKKLKYKPFKDLEKVITDHF